MKHVCEYCGSEWRFPISAALCCDAVSNDSDNDNDPPRVVRAYD